MHQRLFLATALVLAVGLSSCLTDEVAPNIILRNASGDTIRGDTLTGMLNSVLTLVAETTDDQDILDVSYFQGYPGLIEEQINYAIPIELTNRRHEVFVDLSFPDSLYNSNDVSSIRVKAEDRSGNVSEISALILVQ